MPGVIEPETINVDKLPGIWSPVQWELSEEERIQELHTQATASLLWAVDIPEAILRLLLGLTGIDRTLDPPEDYDAELQGEWDEKLVTFKFKHPIHLERFERERDYLYVEYQIDDLGWWAFEIEPDKISLKRI
jgi:hypothetical protein